MEKDEKVKALAEQAVKIIVRWSQGNPGAMTGLINLFKKENIDHALTISKKLEECPSIRGTNLYVLFSDLGNRDYKLIRRLCELVPNDVLEDACSRQDYSGKDIIQKYLDRNDS